MAYLLGCRNYIISTVLYSSLPTKTHADAAYDNRLQFKHNFEVWAHLQDFPDTFTTKATS